MSDWSSNKDPNKEKFMLLKTLSTQPTIDSVTMQKAKKIAQELIKAAPHKEQEVIKLLFAIAIKPGAKK